MVSLLFLFSFPKLGHGRQKRCAPASASTSKSPLPLLGVHILRLYRLVPEAELSILNLERGCYGLQPQRGVEIRAWARKSGRSSKGMWIDVEEYWVSVLIAKLQGLNLFFLRSGELMARSYLLTSSWAKQHLWRQHGGTIAARWRLLVLKSQRLDSCSDCGMEVASDRILVWIKNERLLVEDI